MRINLLFERVSDVAVAYY